MPELPEVETVKNTLKRLVLNKRINNVKVLYPNMIEYPSVEEFIKELKGKTIIDIKRRGKWLLFEFDNKYLVSHLRMEGKFFIHEHSDPVNKHEHVIFSFDDNELRYQDTRKFGRMYLIDKDKFEFCIINEETAELLKKTKESNHKIIAVGTTSTRTLESVMNLYGCFRACSFWTDIFIYPGYEFKAIDSLITNFHLPKSTLVMLVSALAGKEHILNAYNEAIKEKYRFFSFGDAMFINDFNKNK